jgi:hypothetical protein
MSFDLSPHLYKRLELRKIPRQVLEAVLETPEQVLIQEDGTKVYQSKFESSNGKTYLFRVFVNDSIEPARVKSVYKTSQINKYWRNDED